MKDRDFDEMMHKAFASDSRPEDKLNQEIILKIKEKENMKVNKFTRMPLKVAAACCLLLVGSLTVFAAQRYLSSKDIAAIDENKSLAKAFESEGAIEVNEQQIGSDYRVTLLGMVSGENISDFAGMDADDSIARTYAVAAIESTDGTPMPDTSDDNYGNTQFFISPLINGLNPNDYNIVTMNGGYKDVVRDGIMYRLIECDTIELFADKGVSLCVMDTTFYDAKGYNFDEEDGSISRNKNYDGMNLLFNLPLDVKKADAAKAEKYLNTFNNDAKTDKNEKNTEGKQDKESKEETDDILLWMTSDIDSVIKYGKLISERTVKADKDGMVDISFEGVHTSGKGESNYDMLFFDGETRNMQVSGGEKKGDAVVYIKGENKDVIIQVYEINEKAAATLKKLALEKKK